MIFSDSSERLQSITAFYSFKQNPMVMNNMKQKNHPILFILMMSDFGYISFTDFKLQFKIFTLVFSNLKLIKFNIAVTAISDSQPNQN